MAAKLIKISITCITFSVKFCKREEKMMLIHNKFVILHHNYNKIRYEKSQMDTPIDVGCRVGHD